VTVEDGALVAVLRTATPEQVRLVGVRLRAYARPATVFTTAEFPLLDNGKTDVRRLAELVAAGGLPRLVPRSTGDGPVSRSALVQQPPLRGVGEFDQPGDVAAGQ
jgi:hypothetical protein